MTFISRFAPCNPALATCAKSFVFVCASLLVSTCSIATAQTITAPGQASLTHNQNDANQTFSEGTWSLQNASINGATTNWTCGPFVHASFASRKADCRMQIRLITADGLANWSIVTASDTTNHGAGDNSATVTARSTFSGNATVGLTVTFVQSDFSVLTAGDYRVTVTGTITAN